MATFSFSYNVPVPRYPSETNSGAQNFGGTANWQFTVAPERALQKAWTLTMTGMQWFTNEDGTYDRLTHPERNLALFLDFIEEHRLYKSFSYVHPSEGPKNVRFQSMPEIPKAFGGGTGHVPDFEVQIIESLT